MNLSGRILEMILYKNIIAATFFSLTTTLCGALQAQTIPIYGSPELVPFHYYNDGEVVGLWADLVNELSAHSGLSFEQRLMDVRNARDHILETGERAGLGVIAQDTWRREGYEDFIFSEPFFSFNLRFYTNSLSGLLADSSAVDFDKIAVIGARGGFARRWLEQQLPEQSSNELVPVMSFSEGLQLVLDNEVDAFFGLEAATRFAYSQSHSEYAGLIESPVIFSNGASFAFHRDQPELIEIINQFRDYAQSNKILDDLYLDWVQFAPLTPQQFLERKAADDKIQLIYLQLSLLMILLLFIMLFVLTKYSSNLKEKNKFLEKISRVRHDILDPLTQLENDQTSDARLQYIKDILTSEFLENTTDPSETHVDVFIGSQKEIWREERNLKFINNLKKNQNFAITHVQEASRVISNLISNAVRNNGGKSVIVTFTSKSVKGPNVLLVKIENSSEIPQEVLKYINSQNYQKPPNFHAQRNGIGLEIVKYFCEKNRWRLHAEVDVTGKSTVSVEMDGAGHEKLRRIKAPDSFINKKVIIIDDSDFSAAHTASVLSELGAECHVFTNPPEAEAISAAGKFDFYFIDYRLPEMTGVSLAESLIKNLKIKKQSIKIMSGATKDELQKLAKGFNTVTKPLRTEDL